MSYRIRHGEPVADEIRRICLEEIDDTLTLLEGQRAGGEGFAEAVHGARKNLKKLRALLRLVQDALGDEVRMSENIAFRDAGRLLSTARDAEVLVKTLAGLRERHAEEAPPEAWESAGEVLARDRDERLAEFQAGTAPFDAARVLYEARLRVADWPLDGLGWGDLFDGVERIYRQGRRRLAKACEARSTEAEHDWRKRVKDLWYHLRLLRAAWPDVMNPLAEDFAKLADALGDSHDLAVLQHHLEARCHGRVAREHVDALSALIGGWRPRIQRAAAAYGERLYTDKPRAFARRLARYRRTWHEELR